MIGYSPRGSEVHWMWENVGTCVDMSAEKASPLTTNIYSSVFAGSVFLQPPKHLKEYLDLH